MKSVIPVLIYKFTWHNILNYWISETIRKENNFLETHVPTVPVSYLLCHVYLQFTFHLSLSLLLQSKDSCILSYMGHYLAALRWYLYFPENRYIVLQVIQVSFSVKCLCIINILCLFSARQSLIFLLIHNRVFFFLLFEKSFLETDPLLVNCIASTLS